MSDFVDLPGGRLLAIPAWTLAPGGRLSEGLLLSSHPDGHVAAVLFTDEDAALRHVEIHAGADFSPVMLKTRQAVALFLESAMARGVTDTLVDPSVGTTGIPYPIRRLLRSLRT